MEVVSDRMEGAWVPDAGSTVNRPELPPAPEPHMRETNSGLTLPLLLCISTTYSILTHALSSWGYK